MAERDAERPIPSLQDYLYPRVVSTAGASTVYGMSVGFVAGEVSLPVTFYSFGALGLAGGLSFFSTAYGVRVVRRELLKHDSSDDFINYAVSGGINAGLVSTLRQGWKRGLFSSAVGAAMGAVFYLSGSYLYRETRSAWIEYRRYMQEESVERTVLHNTTVTLSSKKSIINLNKGSITAVDLPSKNPFLKPDIDNSNKNKEQGNKPQ